MPRRRRRSASSLDDDDDDDDDFANSDDQSTNSGRCPPQQRNAANARERARMRVLSKAFCRLKTTLPWVPADTKLSKLDTLRLASGYIAHLRALLADQPTEDYPQSGRPLNLTWPFTFQQGVAGAWSANPSKPTNFPTTTTTNSQTTPPSINADVDAFNNNCYASRPQQSMADYHGHHQQQQQQQQQIHYHHQQHHHHHEQQQREDYYDDGDYGIRNPYASSNDPMKLT